MTQETKHTPTPWFSSADGCIGTTEDGFNPIPHYSGMVEMAYYKEPLALANAEFIVRACNSHDEMIAAVEECIRAEMNRRAKLLHGSPASDYTNKRIARLVVALAKARGEA